MSRPIFDLAIGGAGSTALIFLYQYLQLLAEREAGEGQSILIVDPSARSGSGRPYQAGDRTSLLNTRTGSTSALFKDPAHFWRWVQAHESELRGDFPGLDTSAEGFVPRSVFGRYLESLYAECVQMARRLRVRIERSYCRLHDARSEAGGRVVVLHTGEGTRLARCLVLCTGNPPGRALAHLQGSANYIADPYPTDVRLAGIPRDSTVCVVGAGLTGTDVVISLALVHGVKRIVTLSRNGRLQSVKSTSLAQPVLTHLAPESIARREADRGRKMELAELWDCYCREVEAFGGQPVDLAAVLLEDLPAREYLEREIGASEAGHKPWQAVLYAVNNVIEHVWHGLSDAAKREFLARHRDAFMSYKVGIPLVNARHLRSLLADGRLQVLKSVQKTGCADSTGRFRICGQEAHSGVVHTMDADFVVNATGFSVDYASCDDPLIRSLLDSGQAVASPFGGFVLDFETGCLVGRDGSIAHNIHCLGTAGAGTYFWTSAIDVNARLAYRMACRLAERQPVRAPALAGAAHG